MDMKGFNTKSKPDKVTDFGFNLNAHRDQNNFENYFKTNDTKSKQHSVTEHRSDYLSMGVVKPSQKFSGFDYNTSFGGNKQKQNYGFGYNMEYTTKPKFDSGFDYDTTIYEHKATEDDFEEEFLSKFSKLDTIGEEGSFMEEDKDKDVVDDEEIVSEEDKNAGNLNILTTKNISLLDPNTPTFVPQISPKSVSSESSTRSNKSNRSTKSKRQKVDHRISQILKNTPMSKRYIYDRVRGDMKGRAFVNKTKTMKEIAELVDHYESTPRT
eukprot:218711_1